MNGQHRIRFRLLSFENLLRSADEEIESSSRLVLVELQERVEQCWLVEFSQSVDLSFEEILSGRICSQNQLLVRQDENDLTDRLREPSESREGNRIDRPEFPPSSSLASSRWAVQRRRQS